MLAASQHKKTALSVNLVVERARNQCTSMRATLEECRADVFEFQATQAEKVHEALEKCAELHYRQSATRSRLATMESALQSKQSDMQSVRNNLAKMRKDLDMCGKIETQVKKKNTQCLFTKALSGVRNARLGAMSRQLQQSEKGKTILLRKVGTLLDVDRTDKENRMMDRLAKATRQRERDAERMRKRNRPRTAGSFGSTKRRRTMTDPTVPVSARLTRGRHGSLGRLPLLSPEKQHRPNIFRIR